MLNNTDFSYSRTMNQKEFSEKVYKTDKTDLILDLCTNAYVHNSLDQSKHKSYRIFLNL